MRPRVWCQAWLGGPHDTCELCATKKLQMCLTHIGDDAPIEEIYGDIALWRLSGILLDWIGSTQKRTMEDYAHTGRPEATEGIFIDLPLNPFTDQWDLLISLADDRKGSPPQQRRQNVIEVNVVRIPRQPFCQQIRGKLFTKNVTRLPNGIALLTCEWGALQRLAHQNPLDLTRVAITWHIKAISAPTPHPPTLSISPVDAELLPLV